MHNVLIDVLQAIVAQTSQQEPAPHIFVLLFRQGIHADSSAINVHGSKMAGKLSLILGNQPPFGAVIRFTALDVKSSNLVAAELKPEHVVGQVEVKVIAIGV